MVKTNNNSIYIVLRDLEAQEFQLLRQNTSSEVLFFDKSTFDKYSAHFTSRLIEIQEVLKEEINKEVMQILLGIPELILRNPKLKALIANDFSIWHYQRFRAYFDVRNSMYLCRSIERIDSSSLTIFSNDPIIIDHFGQKDNTIVHRSTETIRLKKNYRSILKFLLATVAFLPFGVFKSRKIRKKKFLFVSSPNHYNDELNSTQNRYYGKILSGSRQDSGILYLLPFPKISGDNRMKYTLSDFHKTRDLLSLPSPYLVTSFLRKSVRLAIKQKSRELREVYAEIATMNPGIEKYLLDRLRINHSSSLIYLFQFISFKRFFSSSKCSVLVAIDENSPSIKSIIDAAKSSGIKTAGIQHGSIHELHPAYVYSQSDAKMNNLVDHMFVWGKQTFDFLTKDDIFPRDSVHIIGQPRTDFISTEKTLYTNTNLFGSFDRNNLKVILFFSQPQRDEKIRRQAAIDVFSLVSRQPNEYILVKVHPNEDISYYQKIADELNLTSGYTIFKNEVDLYDALGVADLVITCFSTVGAEAALFKKPLITIDYLRQDIQNYVKYGIAVPVTNRDELKENVHRLLYTSEVNFRHEEFVREYNYKVDGNVAVRFWKHVESISNNL